MALSSMLSSEEYTDDMIFDVIKTLHDDELKNFFSSYLIAWNLVKRPHLLNKLMSEERFLDLVFFALAKDEVEGQKFLTKLAKTEKGRQQIFKANWKMTPKVIKNRDVAPFWYLGSTESGRQLLFMLADYPEGRRKILEANWEVVREGGAKKGEATFLNLASEPEGQSLLCKLADCREGRQKILKANWEIAAKYEDEKGMTAFWCLAYFKGGRELLLKLADYSEGRRKIFNANWGAVIERGLHQGIEIFDRLARRSPKSRQLLAKLVETNAGRQKILEVNWEGLFRPFDTPTDPGALNFLSEMYEIFSRIFQDVSLQKQRREKLLNLILEKKDTSILHLHTSEEGLKFLSLLFCDEILRDQLRPNMDLTQKIGDKTLAEVLEKIEVAINQAKVGSSNQADEVLRPSKRARISSSGGIWSRNILSTDSSSTFNDNQYDTGLSGFKS